MFHLLVAVLIVPPSPLATLVGALDVSPSQSLAKFSKFTKVDEGVNFLKESGYQEVTIPNMPETSRAFLSKSIFNPEAMETYAKGLEQLADQIQPDGTVDASKSPELTRLYKDGLAAMGFKTSDARFACSLRGSVKVDLNGKSIEVPLERKPPGGIGKNDPTSNLQAVTPFDKEEKRPDQAGAIGMLQIPKLEDISFRLVASRPRALEERSKMIAGMFAFLARQYETFGVRTRAAGARLKVSLGGGATGLLGGYKGDLSALDPGSRSAIEQSVLADYRKYGFDSANSAQNALGSAKVTGASSNIIMFGVISRSPQGGTQLVGFGLSWF